MSTLEVRDLTVRFGGNVAVDNVSLQVRSAAITGLIGPNGAGKTTTFNACSGLLAPSAGSVVLSGQDVTNQGPAARARKGIGRTFQRAGLFDSLTVLENVELGREALLAGANPIRQLAAARHDRTTVRRAADEALALCGVEHLAQQVAGDLSTGQRRLVELARVLAGDYQILLLDEPSSGLDHDETEAFGAVLQQVTAERGVGILLVEHDVPLVMRLCAWLYVLDFGRLIFEGTTAEAQSSDVVRAAYLGEGAA